MRRTPLALLSLVALLGGLAACGSDEIASSTTAPDDRPVVVATTTILGDVVENLVGDRAEVRVLMPPGADPHDVALSARQAAELRQADAVIANGAGFEAGFGDALDAAATDGVPTHEAIDGIATLDGADDHEDEAEEHPQDEDAHAEEGEEGHDHEGVDPHFFTDPGRMADAVDGIATFLASEVPALDDDAFRAGAEEYEADLRDLTEEIGATLDAIPAEERILVTNHEVFAYFADRYDFEVVGAIIPGGGTGAEPDARALDALAETIEHEAVPAIFADVSSPTTLAAALAAEVGDVEVVALFSESLGEAGSGGATYGEMVRTNAARIVAALT